MRTSQIIAIILLVCGCAQGRVTTSSPSADAGADQGAPSSDGGTTADAPSVPFDVSPPLCGECCPGATRCVDDTQMEICNQQGTGYDPVPCPPQTVCELNKCVTPPECTAGEKRCYDDSTIMTCRNAGEGWTTSPCQDGLHCVQGQCQAGGAPGTECAANTECASSLCHCGTDESCNTIFVAGYCTTPCAGGSDCAENERCFASSSAPLGAADADYDHCVESCAASCSGDDLACMSLPVYGDDGDVIWEQGCYFAGVASIGEECTSDGACIGGFCLTDYFSTNFCTRRCDEDGMCPEGTVCAEMRTDAFWCMPTCGDGSVVGDAPCPMDMPQDRFDVTCRNRPTFTGDVMRVCAAT